MNLLHVIQGDFLCYFLWKKNQLDTGEFDFLLYQPGQEKFSNFYEKKCHLNS